MKRSLKLAAIQHLTNKRLESTQLADLLGTTSGPPVDKHCPTSLAMQYEEHYTFYAVRDYVVKPLIVSADSGSIYNE
jgi:hypothetical protein